MDIRKIAMFLAGRLPPYYGESNLRSFTKKVRKFAPKEFTNDEMLFIQQQAKNIEEEVYFMIIDDLWKEINNGTFDGKTKEDFFSLMLELGVKKEILGIDFQLVNNKGDLLKLITDLSSINTGKDDSKKFEIWTGDFMKMIFGDSMKDLYLKEQVTSQDGLDIRDWVILNNSKNDFSTISSFWEDVAKKTYDSNFVVIECKNYTDPANQNIINSTMKYLEQPGIGRLCFLFTRKGLIDKGDDKVLKLLRGASKKDPICVLVFDDDDYSKLINLKISGEKPEKYLLDRYFDLQTKL